MSGCDRCGHDYIDHDFTPFGQPRGCDIDGCECPEYIEPEENDE